MISSKSGLGVGQVFIFVLAAITFALIMIFGYKAINAFLVNGERVQLIQFKTDLENSIDKIYTDPGAMRTESYRLPAKYELVCFLDLDYPPEQIEQELGSLCAQSPPACDAWKDVLAAKNTGKGGYSSVEENVFVRPMIFSPIKVSPIKIHNPDPAAPGGYFCEKINQGRFSLVLEAKGAHVEISKAQPASG